MERHLTEERNLDGAITLALTSAMFVLLCRPLAADEAGNGPPANPAASAAATSPAATNPPAPAAAPTTAPSAETTHPPAPQPPPAEGPAKELPEISIYGHLEEARNQILPSLGATSYSINKTQIEQMSGAENAPMNQVLLRSPGVAQDSFGGLHVRGEHANLQYRINGVIIPEGITLFGQELDARFVDSMALTTGSLPAEYGYRTAGIVDIHTKSGAIEPGGEVGIQLGSFDTVRPFFAYGGSDGKLTYFVDGSYDQNDIGIENPTSSYSPVHDETDQYKFFSYLSYVLDDTSRINLMFGAVHDDFQIPDTPGLPPGTQPNGNPWVPGIFNSRDLNENQNEQNYFAIVSYQKALGDLNYQVSAFGRYSAAHFIPDKTGDLFFNGLASDVNRMLTSGGVQGDASYKLNDQHTLRGGLMVVDELLTSDTTTTVFPVDAAGNETGPAFPITDNTHSQALFADAYLQDEWKMTRKLTLNYGARFDVFTDNFDNEYQLSPRVNAIYKPTEDWTIHGGYARYFTPPPLENVPVSGVTIFNGTSNASPVTLDSPVKAESADYFDAGVSHKFLPGLQGGVDGYFKWAHNQLDGGLFGQTLIPSAFNYERGRVYGVEFTASYIQGGLSTYGNLAISRAQGEHWDSAQFLFDPAQLAYTKDHWIFLDHDQLATASAGVSYTWKKLLFGGDTMAYADVIFGTGLRQDEVNASGEVIPNGDHVPSYYSANLGAEQRFKLSEKRLVKVRFDVVNVTDNVYELRSGTGVGVSAPQYGMRRGFFLTVAYDF
jgi:outer membrane receptor protein involved in Fe transport